MCLLYLLCLSRFELVWPAEQVPVCLMALKFSLQVQDCKGPSGVCQTQWPMGTEADRHHWPHAHREPGHLVIMLTCVFQLLDFCFGSIGQVWSLSKTEKMLILYSPTNVLSLTDQHIEAMGLNNPECTRLSFVLFLMRVFCAETKVLQMISL